jgi:hypothetical protein
MKKSVILAAVLTLFAATGAMAEHASSGQEVSGHKLLVTDVPDPGQIEARMDYVYSYAEGKNELDEKIKDEKSAGSVTLAAGVVKGLKLSASMPYTFVQHQENTKIEGFGDLTLGARYSLTKGLVHLPVDTAVGFDWQLNTASTKPGKPGSGANVYSPYLAVSKAVGMAIPYFKYQPDVIAKQDRNQTNHNLIFGAELEFSHALSLDISLKTVINGSANKDIKGTLTKVESSTDVEIELMPYINIAKNTYLLPRVAYKFVGDVKDTAGVKVTKDVGEFKTGLGLYFLF